MPTLMTILGTRPEIIRVSPVLPLLDRSWRSVVVHTGEWSEPTLDRQVWAELRLRLPDVRLDLHFDEAIGVTPQTLDGLMPTIREHRPDAILVCGGSKSAYAGMRAAHVADVPLIQLEAGQRTYTEDAAEIRRVAIDRSAVLLLAPHQDAQDVLVDEGHDPDSITVVGSMTVDACLRHVRYANRSTVLARLRVPSRGFLVCSIHQPNNLVPAVLHRLVGAVNQLAQGMTVVVLLHPHTVVAMQQQGLHWAHAVAVVEALPYIDMLQLLRHACAVLTDSDGLRIEAGVLNVPALALDKVAAWRPCSDATASLVDRDPERVLGEVVRVLGEASAPRGGGTSGHMTGAGDRCTDAIGRWLGQRQRSDDRGVHLAPVGA